MTKQADRHSGARTRSRTTMVAGGVLLAAAVVISVAAMRRGVLSPLRMPSAVPPHSDVPSVLVDSIASPAAPGSVAPSLTPGPSGHVYMTWFEPSEAFQALRFASFDGQRWSAPRTIRQGADFFVNWADFPALKMLGDNRLAVHWLQRTPGSSFAYGIRIAQSTDGGVTWSMPVTPHRDSAMAEHGFVSVWNDGDGAAVVWLDGRKVKMGTHTPSNEMMLMTTHIGPHGELQDELQLDPRTCDCCQTAAAVTSAGPVVVYRDRSADEVRDIQIVRRVGGKWSAPALVSHDNWHINACPVNGPAVAARAHAVAVAWFTAPNDDAQVNVAFSTNDGASFGTPVRIDEGNPAGRVDIGLLPDGAALVTWVERMGGGEAAVMRARRVSPTGQRGNAITVATATASRASGFPRLVIGGNSDAAYFAWTIPGSPSRVRVARLALASLK